MDSLRWQPHICQGYFDSFTQWNGIKKHPIEPKYKGSMKEMLAMLGGESQFSKEIVALQSLPGEAMMYSGQINDDPIADYILILNDENQCRTVYTITKLPTEEHYKLVGGIETNPDGKIGKVCPGSDEFEFHMLEYQIEAQPKFVMMLHMKNEGMGSYSLFPISTRGVTGEICKFELSFKKIMQ